MKYNTKFFDAQSSGSVRSAQKVVPTVIRLLEPRSVLDVGCGRGGWLRVAADNGINEIFGVDGAWAEKAGLLIDRDRFLTHDLGTPFDLGRKFDLAMTLEVAEHITAASADTFVDNLCRHSETILFSAAVPGQGGVLHVNEQPLGYWVGKFARHGLVVVDVLRPLFWADDDIGPCYRQNIVMFAGSARAAAIRDAAARMFGAPAAPLDVVHPQLLKERADYMAFSPIVRVKFAAKLLLSLFDSSYRTSL
jgi:SAM-dependent methyltransferase